MLPSPVEQIRLELAGVLHLVLVRSRRRQLEFGLYYEDQSKQKRNNMGNSFFAARLS